jgi:phospholipid/cholesterol/gamma-HCH transport system permease protein
MTQSKRSESGSGASTPQSGPEHSHHTLDTPIEEAAYTIEEAGRLSFRVARDVVVGTIAYLGEVLVLLTDAFRSLRHGLNVGDLVRQMSVMGVESIPICLLAVGFSGAVFSLYTIDALQTYGATDLVGGVVAISILRELGPLLTGVCIAARAGSAITAEIGSMKVTEQVDALRSMAVSPVEYLVLPRLIACLIMLPLICVWADVAGVVGGAVVSLSKGIGLPAYWSSMRQLLDPSGSDVTKGLIKTIFFGAIIVAVGCREGLATSGGASGVGQATTRSVVVAIVLIFIADFLLTFLLYDSGLF